MSGAFPGATWSTPGDNASMLMSRVGTSLIYTKTMVLPKGTYEYKYFKNAGWSNGEYPGGANRSAVVTGDHTFNDTWGGNINWANLQWPASGSIAVGGGLDVYAQVYINQGVTGVTGGALGLQTWIGVSTSNTNPSTWTTWIPATYTSAQGNNDEYKANIGALLAAGTYYYASRFQLTNGAYVYGGFNSGYWDGTTNVSGVLTVGASPSKTLNITAYLQGFWNGTGMNQAQNADVDFNTWNNFSGTTVDTLSVYLANATAPYATVFAAHGVNINTSGLISVSVPGALTGNYYVAILHRSSVETWSANPLSFSEDLIGYNFTTSANQAFGSNQFDLLGDGTKWGFFGGEIYGSGSTLPADGWIDLNDLNPVYNDNVGGAFGYKLEDITGDGFVDLSDLNIVYNNLVVSVGPNTPPNPMKRPKKFKQ